MRRIIIYLTFGCGDDDNDGHAADSCGCQLLYEAGFIYWCESYGGGLLVLEALLLLLPNPSRLGKILFVFENVDNGGGGSFGSGGSAKAWT